jgi:two-component system chemotaxis sensor kinase CheA
LDPEDQHLREKARLLLQREREYFELLQKYERLGVWLNLGQALPELFLDRKSGQQQLWDRVRKLLIGRLRLQRVVIVELAEETLVPLSPAGVAKEVSSVVRSFLDAHPSGICNDPDGADAACKPLADQLGLHRFMWSRIASGTSSHLLLGAGFDRAKASFQALLVENDAAFFKNTTQHIESLLANARLVAELEVEKALLEQRVEERTSELAGRNGELRLVLDNIDQALVTIDLDGRLRPERSRAVDRWFGAYSGEPRFLEVVPADARFGALFRLGLGALRDQFLPLAVCLDQLPKEMLVGERCYACRYLPIGEGESVTALLLVIDDVTELRARARAEGEQRELMAAFTALMRDRSGFLAFVEETEQLFARLSQSAGSVLSQRQALHTLKGNAATFGLSVIAAQTHTAEDELAETGRLSGDTIERVRGRWLAIRSALRAVAPAELRPTIEVTDEQLASLVEQAAGGSSAASIVEQLRRLAAEPVERSLERLAQHAKALAGRLGKPGLVVEIAADDIRLTPAIWTPLWSALLHVVRNAVDHGIEPLEERAAHGKPPTGRLRLSARRHEAGYRLELADDGRGVDWRRVRQKCEEQGRPCGGRAELVAALLAPDFSTRAQVSDVSGRGVGLSAVLAAVRGLGGSLELESDPGVGTCVSLIFPSAG